MTEPAKRGPGRPRVEKTPRKPRVYKLTDTAGVSERFACSLPPELRDKIRRSARKNGVREAEQVRKWIADAPE